MTYSLLRWLLTPFRYGAVSFYRGFFLRSACIAVIKLFSKNRVLLTGLMEVRPVDRLDLSFVPSDSMVISEVFWFGVQGYEGMLASIWQNLCIHASHILEIGGNVGFYTVIGSKTSTTAYTVLEPVPEIASVLNANLARNEIGHVVVLQAAAIPETLQQQVLLNVPDEGTLNPVGSHLVSGSEVSGRTSKKIIRVPGLPFHDLIQDCDLIKIDAEGLEFALLTSAKQVIQTKRPTILIEVLPESVHLGTLLAELAETCNYFIHVIPAYGTHKITIIPASKFTSSVPRQYNSKDIILSCKKLNGAGTILNP